MGLFNGGELIERLLVGYCRGAKRIVYTHSRHMDAWPVKLLVSLLASLVLVAACDNSIHERPPEATPTRALGPGEQWVPFAPIREIAGGLVQCAGTGWSGAGHLLTGSPTDPRLAWMNAGDRQELEWPVGYSARFTPQLELLNEDGVVVGYEGTELAGGCEMAPGIWQVDLPCDRDDATLARANVPPCDDRSSVITH